MQDFDNLESWLTKNNISELLQTLEDNGVEDLSDLNTLHDMDESEFAEFIEGLDLDHGLENKFKKAFSDHSTMQGTSEMNKESHNLAKNNDQPQTETKMSCGDDIDEDHATSKQNKQYKALLKDGFNIVASTKREYILSKLKANEYAYKGGNGYNEETVLIETTIRDLNADKNEIQVKQATRQPEKLFAD
eukprot:502960_1